MACKIPDRLVDFTAKQVFYCSFERFNAKGFAVPPDTVILADEFHELFFNQPATVHNGKLVSVVSKLQSATRLVGVSANFRGDDGLDKINTILAATFIQTGAELKDMKLELEVFGKVRDIPTKAVQLV